MTSTLQGNDYSLTMKCERLAEFINTHEPIRGFCVNGSLFGQCEQVDRDGNVQTVTEQIEPNAQAVRDWLGY